MARILIVEDEPLIAMMLEDWLTEMGHQPVGPVDCVSKALQCVEAAAPDAAILDVKLRASRSDPIADILGSRGIPFAFATGDSSDSVDARFVGVPRIGKPYDFETIRLVTERLTDGISKTPQLAE